jgi:cytochrome c oxidase subunit 3
MKPAMAWLIMTILLGLAFAAGQVQAWRHMAAQGIFLPSHPHSSFFYMLTGLHVAHLVGGIGAMMYAVARIKRADATVTQENSLKLCATYWHFVGGLWVYLFIVLFVF